MTQHDSTPSPAMQNMSHDQLSSLSLLAQASVASRTEPEVETKAKASSTQGEKERGELDSIVDSVMSGIVMPYAFIKQQQSASTSSSAKSESEAKSTKVDKFEACLTPYPFPAAKLSQQMVNDSRAEKARPDEEQDTCVLALSLHFCRRVRVDVLLLLHLQVAFTVAKIASSRISIVVG